MSGYSIQDRVILIEGEPSTNPPSGIVFIYVNSSDELIVRNSSGDETTVSDTDNTKRYSLLMS